MSDKEWSGKSKGSKIGYQIFIYTIRFLPLSLNYVLLRFVSYFYYLFTSTQKENLKSFYHAVFPLLSKTEINQLVKNNYYQFSQAILDRVAFLTDKKKSFTFKHDGHHKIEDCLKEGKGLFLIGSHLGNWEIAGEMLHERGISAKVNVLLLDQEREQVKEVLDSAKRKNSFEIIPLRDDFSHIIKIKNALARGEIVCTTGDRYFGESRTVDVEFFGENISLPLGIFKFIEKFKAPTLYFFNVKTSDTTYLLHAIDANHKQAANEIAIEYKNVLEKMVKKYPAQFYNYFMFLKK